MSILSKIFSVILSLVMTLTGAPLSGVIDTVLDTQEYGLETQAEEVSDVKAVVPETIYLNPSNNKSFQYYLNDNSDGTAKAGAAESSGMLYFSASGVSASNVTVACEGNTTTGAVSISYGTASLENGANKRTFTGSIANALTAGSSTTIKFTFTYGGKEYYNYSTLYAPSLDTVCAISAGNIQESGISDTAVWTVMFGIHGIITDSFGDVSLKTSAGLALLSQESSEDGSCKYKYDLRNHTQFSNYHGGVAPSTNDILASINNGGGGSYWYKGWGNGTDGRAVSGGKGRIYYDSSRQTTVSHIPNFYLHSYVGDFRYDGTWEYTKMEDNDQTWYMTNRSNVIQDYGTYGSKVIKRADGVATQIPDPDLSDVSLGDGYILYNNIHRVWRQRNWIDSHQTRDIYAIVACQFTDVNKSKLRANVENAVKYLDYSVWGGQKTEYDAFVAAYEDACEALGSVTATKAVCTEANDNLDITLYVITGANESLAVAKFYVPESIYVSGDGKTGKYFYGVNNAGSVETNISLTNAEGGALVYWSGKVNLDKITCQLSTNEYTFAKSGGQYDEPTSDATVDSGIASMTVGSVERTTTATVNSGWGGGSATYNETLSAITLADSYIITAGKYRFLKWTAYYTCNDKQYTQVAYTVLLNANTEYKVNVGGIRGSSKHRARVANSTIIYGMTYGVSDTTISNINADDGLPNTNDGNNSDALDKTIQVYFYYDSERFTNFTYVPFVKSKAVLGSHRDNNVESYFQINGTEVAKNTSGTSDASKLVNVYTEHAITCDIPASKKTSFLKCKTQFTADCTGDLECHSYVDLNPSAQNKSAIRSAYQMAVKNQNYNDDTKTVNTSYEFNLLKMACCVAVPGTRSGSEYLNKTVTLDHNGGSVNGSTANTTLSTTQNFGDDLSEATVTEPTKANLNFAGYYNDENQKQYYDDRGLALRCFEYTDNKTLTAHWQYTVHFDGNGSTDGSMEDQIFDEGVAKTLSPNSFSRELSIVYDATTNGGTCGKSNDTIKYNFAGWYRNSACTGTGYTDKQSVKDINSDGSTVNLYAKWTSASPSVQLPAATAPTGYTFAGWYTEPHGGNLVGDSGAAYTPPSSEVLYAQFTPNTYKVSFDVNYGNANVNLPLAPTEMSKTVGGVTCTYDPAKDTFKLNDTYTGGAESILTLPFFPEAGDYTFTVELVGGTQESGDGYPVLEARTSAGANLSTNVTERVFVDLNDFTDNNKKITAVKTFTPDTASKCTNIAIRIYKNGSDNNTFENYEFRFKVEKASSATPMSPLAKNVNFDSEYGELPTPVRNGYTFKGWYEESACENEVEGTDTVATARDHTLFAKWEAGTVEVNLNNGTDVDPGSISGYCEIDSFPSSVTKPTNGDYIFVGYFTEEDGGGTKYYDKNGSLAINPAPKFGNGVTDLYAYWDTAPRVVSYETSSIDYSTGEAEVKFSFSDNSKVAKYYFGTTQNAPSSAGKTITNGSISWDNNTSPDKVSPESMEDVNTITYYLWVEDENENRSAETAITFYKVILNKNNDNITVDDPFTISEESPYIPVESNTLVVPSRISSTNSSHFKISLSGIYKNPLITGYDLSGWKESGSDTVYTGEYEVKSTKTLYAVWETLSKDYTVHYITDDGVISTDDGENAVNVPAGQPIINYLTASKYDGFTVNGYSFTKSSFVVRDENGVNHQIINTSTSTNVGTTATDIYVLYTATCVDTELAKTKSGGTYGDYKNGTIYSKVYIDAVDAAIVDLNGSVKDGNNTREISAATAAGETTDDNVVLDILACIEAYEQALDDLGYVYIDADGLALLEEEFERYYEYYDAYNEFKTTGMVIIIDDFDKRFTFDVENSDYLYFKAISNFQLGSLDGVNPSVDDYGGGDGYASWELWNNYILEDAGKDKNGKDVKRVKILKPDEASGDAYFTEGSYRAFLKFIAKDKDYQYLNQDTVKVFGNDVTYKDCFAYVDCSKVWKGIKSYLRHKVTAYTDEYQDAVNEKYNEFLTIVFGDEIANNSSYALANFSNHYNAATGTFDATPLYRYMFDEEMIADTAILDFLGTFDFVLNEGSGEYYDDGYGNYISKVDNFRQLDVTFYYCNPLTTRPEDKNKEYKTTADPEMNSRYDVLWDLGEEPPVEEYVGHVFNGWYNENLNTGDYSGMDPITFPYYVSENNFNVNGVSYYAGWDAGELVYSVFATVSADTLTTGGSVGLEISINGEPQDDISDATFSTHYYPAGTEITVKAKPTDENSGLKFKFWRDQKTNKVVSENAEYTFNLGENIYLEGIYSNGTTGLITFYDTIGKKVFHMVNYSNDINLNEIGNLAPRYKGYYFAGWDKNPDFSTDTGDMQINTVYEPNRNTYDVRLHESSKNDATMTISDVDENGRAYFDAKVTVTTTSDAFKYWVLVYNQAPEGSSEVVQREEIVSYSETYSFFAYCNVTVRMETIDTQSSKTPLVLLTAYTDRRVDMDHPVAASFTLTRSVPESYQYIASGILVTNKGNTDIGAFYESFTLDNVKSSAGTIVQKKAAYSTANGQYMLNISAMPGKIYYGRAYLTVFNPDDSRFTVYQSSIVKLTVGSNLKQYGEVL